MTKKVTVVDARGHILGRLASTVAKQLLLGETLVIVRTEEIVISGPLLRNKLKYHEFLNKRTNTNPTKGPIHQRSPAKMFARVVRGMLPHKTARGAAALARLKVFEGIPVTYEKSTRVVVPAALRVTHVKPDRKMTRLGDLAKEVGWRHSEAVAALEAQRRVRSAASYEQRKALARLTRLAHEKAVKGESV